MSTTLDNLEVGVMRYVGMTPAIKRTLAEMHRLGRAYHRIQERWCNGEMDDVTTVRLERREARLEGRIVALAETLPDPFEERDGEYRTGKWVVVFEGDPRGWVVALVPMWGDVDPQTVRRATSEWVGVA